MLIMDAAEDSTTFGEDTKTIKYYYSKRNELVPPIPLTSPALDRQMLSIADSTHANSCNGGYEPGTFYEIDHKKLPPKSPTQLKAVRVVMVSETTLLDVTVSFPSTLSLRSYFATAQISDCLPELDEKFVMSSNQAGRILRRRIPLAQLEAGRSLKSFWFMAPASSTSDLPPEKEHEEVNTGIPTGSCLLALKRAEVFGWGIRRKVQYIGMRCTPAEDEANSSGGRKRNREEPIKNVKKKTKQKAIKFGGREAKRPKTENSAEGRCPRGSKDRWSIERYETAEKRLLDIMRQKKAELGTPVLRQALRDEARKHIGDTGLLDHLLKHMAGKVVFDGTERFRRRHNSDGAMEYWLEPADLVEIRRKAGITDPFWIPPPGWNPGDSIFPSTSCGPDCKHAIAELKQQLSAQLTKYHEQQNSLKKLEKEAREMEESQKAICAWQEKYQVLLERKTKQEEELAALIHCMQGLKEEVRLLKEKQTPEVPELAVPQRQNSAGGSISTTTNTGNGVRGDSKGLKKAALRSGFRICKPQGTFLWPSMAGAPGMLNSSSPRAQGAVVPTTFVHVTNTISGTSEMEQKQHLLLFPGGGPPSASSSTSSTPRLLLLPEPGSTSLSLQPRSTNKATEVVAVPNLVTPQRAVCSQKLCYSEYGGTMPCAASSGLCLGTREVDGDDALRAADSLWKSEISGWSGVVGTDLALATPSPYR